MPTALLLVAALAGCLGDGLSEDCLWDPGVATPKLHGAYMQTDPGQAWQTVVLAPPGNASSSLVFGLAAGASWNATTRPVSSQGAGLHVVSVTPGAGPGNVTLDFTERTSVGRCQGRNHGLVMWDLAPPKPGDAAMPGQGVHVMTAGFFENGTLFYTNIAELDTDPRWPRISWYAWEGDLPLPVYVYDASRDEQPVVWKAPSSTLAPITAQAPDTGTPADEAVDALPQDADEETGAGYFTTIPGFNDALQGLSTTTARVVRLEPEQAYTRPGNEEHPLYGHAIVFYIKVLDVVDAPCPQSVQGWACRAPSIG